MKTVYLVMTSAIALAGEIVAAGEVVEVTETEAINFLHRNKARLATAEDGVDVPVDPNAGPTVAEYVAAGYRAENYPPAGYASRSTDEEILAAITAQEAKDEKA